jgi:hypothetical protein
VLQNRQLRHIEIVLWYVVDNTNYLVNAKKYEHFDKNSGS